MPKNLLVKALKGLEESDYYTTKVRGYNCEAAEYASRHASELKKRYGCRMVIAISGKEDRVIAKGKTIEEVVSAVGGLEKIQLPNSKQIMIGKVSDVVSAQRRYHKQVAHLGMLSKMHEEDLPIHASSYRL